MPFPEKGTDGSRPVDDKTLIKRNVPSAQMPGKQNPGLNGGDGLFQRVHRYLPQLLHPLQMSLLPQQNRHMLNRSGGFVISVKIEDLETFQKKLNSNCLRKDEIIE